MIGDVRGIGAMRAFELVSDPETRSPAAQETSELIRHCYERGLILVGAGTFGNVIRLLAPLVITDEQFEEGLDVIESGLQAIHEKTAAHAVVV